MKISNNHYFVIQDINTEHKTLFVVYEGFVNRFKQLTRSYRQRFQVYDLKSSSINIIELNMCGLEDCKVRCSIVLIRSWADLMGQPELRCFYDLPDDRAL